MNRYLIITHLIDNKELRISFLTPQLHECIQSYKHTAEHWSHLQKHYVKKKEQNANEHFHDDSCHHDVN